MLNRDSIRASVQTAFEALWPEHAKQWSLRHGRSCALREFAFNPVAVAGDAVVAILQECKQNPRALCDLPGYCRQVLMAKFHSVYCGAVDQSSSSQTIAFNQQFVAEFVQSEAFIAGVLSVVLNSLPNASRLLSTSSAPGREPSQAQLVTAAERADTPAVPGVTVPDDLAHSPLSQLPQLNSPDAIVSFTQMMQGALAEQASDSNGSALLANGGSTQGGGELPGVSGAHNAPVGAQGGATGSGGGGAAPPGAAAALPGVAAALYAAVVGHGGAEGGSGGGGGAAPPGAAAALPGVAAALYAAAVGHGGAEGGSGGGGGAAPPGAAVALPGVAAALYAAAVGHGGAECSGGGGGAAPPGAAAALPTPEGNGPGAVQEHWSPGALRAVIAAATRRPFNNLVPLFANDDGDTGPAPETDQAGASAGAGAERQHRPPASDTAILQQRAPAGNAAVVTAVPAAAVPAAAVPAAAQQANGGPLQATGGIARHTDVYSGRMKGRSTVSGPGTIAGSTSQLGRSQFHRLAPYQQVTLDLRASKSEYAGILLKEHKKALEEGPRPGVEDAGFSESGSDKDDSIHEKALKSKVRDYSRRETSRRMNTLKNNASHLTTLNRWADVVLFGLSGASTKCHLHVTGQFSNAMSNSERAWLSKMLFAYVTKPDAREAMWQSVVGTLREQGLDDAASVSGSEAEEDDGEEDETAAGDRAAGARPSAAARHVPAVQHGRSGGRTHGGGAAQPGAAGMLAAAAAHNVPVGAQGGATGSGGGGGGAAQPGAAGMPAAAAAHNAPFGAQGGARASGGGGGGAAQPGAGGMPAAAAAHNAPFGAQGGARASGGGVGGAAQPGAGGMPAAAAAHNPPFGAQGGDRASGGGGGGAAQPGAGGMPAAAAAHNPPFGAQGGATGSGGGGGGAAQPGAGGMPAAAAAHNAPFGAQGGATGSGLWDYDDEEAEDNDGSGDEDAWPTGTANQRQRLKHGQAIELKIWMQGHLDVDQAEAVKQWRSEHGKNPEWSHADDKHLATAYKAARREANGARGTIPPTGGRAGRGSRAGGRGRSGTARAVGVRKRGGGGRGDLSQREGGGDQGTWQQVSPAFRYMLSMSELQVAQVDNCYNHLKEIAGNDSARTAELHQLHALYRERMQGGL